MRFNVLPIVVERMSSTNCEAYVGAPLDTMLCMRATAASSHVSSKAMSVSRSKYDRLSSNASTLTAIVSDVLSVSMPLVKYPAFSCIF